MREMRKHDRSRNIIHVMVLIFIFQCAVVNNTTAQSVPAEDENIPFLVTFGHDADGSWGDDDHVQILFFVVPVSHTTPVYIRVFDPDIGGLNDELRGEYNTKVKFSVIGGSGAFSENDVANRKPIEGYNGGNLLDMKVFGNDAQFDDQWFTFGPFNPVEGELKKEFGGRLFKVIIKGESGDDGNLYRLFLSTSQEKNIPIEGGNAFTFEYTFRLHAEPLSVSHIYPYVDKYTVSVRQYNFDLDNDAYIRIISVDKKGLKVKSSGEGNWVSSLHPITEKEKNSSLDIQIIKTGSKVNNNVAFYITNQYGQFLPFYTIPIGGVPKYQYQIGLKKH